MSIYRSTETAKIKVHAKETAKIKVHVSSTGYLLLLMSSATGWHVREQLSRSSKVSTHLVYSSESISRPSQIDWNPFRFRSSLCLQ